MNGIRSLINRAPESSLTLFLPCEDAKRSWQSTPWKPALTRTQPCWHLDHRFSISRIVWEGGNHVKGTAHAHTLTWKGARGPGIQPALTHLGELPDLVRSHPFSNGGSHCTSGTHFTESP
ncbi:uncharacterized protein LOC144580813 isoform X2 [Callithrix jacchus]